jgi:hypothetical protein
MFCAMAPAPQFPRVLTARAKKSITLDLIPIKPGDDLSRGPVADRPPSLSVTGLVVRERDMPTNWFQRTVAAEMCMAGWLGIEGEDRYSAPQQVPVRWTPTLEQPVALVPDDVEMMASGTSIGLVTGGGRLDDGSAKFELRGWLQPQRKARERHLPPASREQAEHTAVATAMRVWVLGFQPHPPGFPPAGAARRIRPERADVWFCHADPQRPYEQLGRDGGFNQRVFYAADREDKNAVAFSDLPPATAEALEERRQQENQKGWQLVTASPPSNYGTMTPKQKWHWHRALLTKVYGPLPPSSDEQQAAECAYIEEIHASVSRLIPRC